MNITSEHKRISDLNVAEWRKELDDDIDKDFILHGVEHGFMIVDRVNVDKCVETNNHSSCFTYDNKQIIDGLILEEIRNGRYVPVCQKPFICSALAAIEKSDGSLRLILDASRPEDGALNSYSMVQDQVKYERVQDALDLIKPGSFMTKIDIKAAYRAVGIDPSQYHMCGLKWQFTGDSQPTYMVDVRWVPKNRHPSFTE
jgi:hypothetical protein